MSMGTKTIHKWKAPNEDGIAGCENCPSLRWVRGKNFKQYKSRPSADWKRTTPTCTAPKGAVHRAKTCTTASPPISESVPVASNT
jgi:hypothetical protein